jgi:hypothetical protein
MTLPRLLAFSRFRASTEIAPRAACFGVPQQRSLTVRIAPLQAREALIVTSSSFPVRVAL